MKKRCILFLLAVTLLFSCAAAEQDNPSVTDCLEKLGYIYDGQQSLVTALCNFQTANGLLATGTPDAETLQALYSEEAVSQSAYLEGFAEKYRATAQSLADSHADIVSLQEALGNLGYSIGSTDGVYGNATREAVAQFQLANGLFATGEPDASMLIRLYEGTPVAWDAFLRDQCAVRGDTGVNVSRIQERLNKFGYFDGESTGSFGELTQQAVTQFQTFNNLPATGEVNIETCRVLFSDDAEARYEDGELHMGSSGEHVTALQKRLAGLGFYAGNYDGEFNEATRNALMLFQMANDLTVSEYADQNTLRSMENSSPASMEDSAKRFLRTRKKITDEQLQNIAETALSMKGQAFSTLNDGLFPGFDFVQYVYAKVGVVLSDPGEMVQDSALQSYEPGDIPLGAIVIMQRTQEDSVVYSMGVCLGAGRVVYADPESEWLISGSIDQIPYTGLYARVLPDGK